MTLLITLLGCVGSGLVPDLSVEDGERHVRECASVAERAEGEFLWPDGAGVVATREACEAVAHATGGSAGSILSVQIDGFGPSDSGMVRLELRDWNGTVVDSQQVSTVGGSGTAEVTVPWTGEVLLTAAPVGSDIGGDYALDATCVAHCGRWTRSPILLVHGMGDTADRGFAFYSGVLGDLGYRTWDPVVDPYNPTALRAVQWRAHLDAWRTDGTWRTVHVIGHSMGGVDARYLATHLDPDAQIETLTTIGSPHRGSPIADDVLHLVEEYDWADGTVQLLLDILVPGHDGSQDVDALLAQLSTPGMAAFNTEVPDRPDVIYRSWAGKTCHWFAWDCQEAWDGESVGWELAVPLSMLEGHGYYDSDGLVTIESATWGEFQGILSADHLAINGDHGSDDSFDPAAFIAREAARLVAIERGLPVDPEPDATGGVLGQ